MKNKLLDFYLSSFSFDFDVIVISETWLNESINDCEIICTNYNLYRLDRNILNSSKKSGGGVMVAVNKNYSSELVSDLNIDIEFICIRCSSNDLSLLITCSYIPPGVGNEDVYEKHIKHLDHFINSCHSKTKILCFGDFNLPGVEWIYDPELVNCMLPINTTSQMERIFFDSMAALNLYQVNDVFNENNRLLDLVFTSAPDDSKVIHDPVICLTETAHHKQLVYSVDIFNNISDKKIIKSSTVRNFQKANFSLMTDLLSQIDWTCVEFENNIESSLAIFENILYNIFEVCVPYKNVVYENRSPPWLNNEVKKLRNKKDRAFKKFKISNNLIDYSVYKVLRYDFNNAVKISYQDYIEKTKQNLSQDPKQFWWYIKSKKKCDKFPVSMSFYDQTSCDNSTICEYFRQYFQEVYVPSNPVNESDLDLRNNVEIPFMTISAPDICMYIKKLKSNWSYGPDGIPSVVLKNTSMMLCKPLCFLFNLSLRSGVVPRHWKTSFITPLFKSGSKSNIKNYRGICKLSCIPKMFESIVSNFVWFYCNKIISSQQHGFVKGRSTCTNLIELTSKIVSHFEKGQQTDVIYTDFSKAFDRVNHNLLLLKLKALGFPSWLNLWVASYLRDRTQQVIFKNCISSTINVLSGVPQGSHIGPLLFLLFINDLPSSIVHSSVLLYADDCKLFRSIESAEDIILLQSDLDRLCTWCNSNFMSLNSKKCFVMSFNRSGSILDNNYKIDNDGLEKKTSFCDLGVMFDMKCTFNLHVDYILNKAYSKLGCIIRWGREFNDPSLLMTLFCSLVRPHVEYCSSLWCVRYQNNICRIESLQKQFLLRMNRQRINFNQIQPYKERLKDRNLMTLEDRRIMQNILFVFNVLNGKTDFNFMLNHLSINVRTRPSRPAQLQRNFLNERRCFTNYSQHEPVTALIRDFNANYEFIDFHLYPFQLRNKIKKYFLSSY